MKSFSHQASWNTAVSIAGQGIGLLFVALVSRMLGSELFGYYVWVTALPGMVVVFDMYLGLSFQNRLTELVATGDQEGRRRLTWGFLWGMLGISSLFIALGFLVTSVMTLTNLFMGTMRVPSFVVWLGFIQVVSTSLNVPLLVAGCGYNAHREVHRGAAWSLGGDLFSKAVFILVLSLTASFAASMIAFSIATVIGNCTITARFMRVYRIHYMPASWSIVRSAFHDLWTWGSAREWAGLRVADGLFKNSDLIIGTFFISAATIGDFSLLDRLSSALMLAANAVYVPLVPALISAGATGKEQGMNRLTSKAKCLSIAGLILFSIVFLSSGEWLASLWSGHRVEFSFLIVFLVCARAWTRVLSSLYWNILVGYNLIRGLLWTTVCSGIAYLMLYAVLIKSCGVLSIVVSQITGQFVFLGLAGGYLARHKTAANIASICKIQADPVA